jgi:Condensation domain
MNYERTIGAASFVWREALSGRGEATLVARSDIGVASALKQITLSLSETLTLAHEQAQAQGLTVKTYVQGAWAILLGRLTSRDEVVVGVALPEIACIDSNAGLFNTLPLRVKLRPSKPLVGLLKDVQEDHSRLIAHKHLEFAEIQSLFGLS